MNNTHIIKYIKDRFGYTITIKNNGVMVVWLDNNSWNEKQEKVNQNGIHIKGALLNYFLIKIEIIKWYVFHGDVSKIKGIMRVKK